MSIVGEISLGGLLGLAVGLTGVGGAAMTIPVLVLILGFSAASAIATTFPFTAIIKTFGFLQHRHQGSFHWPLAMALSLGSIPTTVLAVLLLARFYERFEEDADTWLNMAIGALLIFSVIVLLIKWASPRHISSFEMDPFGPHQWLQGIALGGFFGLIIGATSVGAGSLMIIPLALTLRLNLAKVVGTTIGVSLVLMLIGTLGFLGTGLVDFESVLYLSIGGIPAVLVGSRLAPRLPEAMLLKLVSLCIVLSGVALIGKGVYSLSSGA